MTPYAHIALAIWLIPVALFALLALAHKRAFFPLIRDWLATAGVGVCLALALYMLVQAWGSPAIPVEAGRLQFEWFRLSALQAVSLGLLVDNLTIIMLVVVTLVSFLVHLFSIGYMRGDARYGRYYCGLLLFTASMIGLVVADNLLALYVFWELVGLSSYILIGHWFERKSAARAAMKAFITTRIGDIGMFLGILVIYTQVGSFAYDDVFAAVADGGLDGAWRTLAGLGLFVGAMGKSAQFPLHVWLPDAMEGPTPVSALIHAATMVAAGVYMVGRLFLVFDAPTFLFIAYIGAVTAFIAATIALVQDDMKRVLAYSTVSQLGFMMLALGVGGYVSGLFHLTTHACFKACLFLGSGSVIYAMHHEQSMAQYGGLWRKMRITSLTFLAACLAIAGFPFLTAGFYSKDAILADVLAFFWREGNSRHVLLPLLGFSTAFLTAFYMFRQYYLTFTGRPRNQERFDHAHESPWTMTVPLIILAVLSIVAGGFHFGPLHYEWFQPMNPAPNVSAYASDAIAAGTTAHTVAHDDVADRAHKAAMALSIILALSGIALATLFYWRGLTAWPARLANALRPVHTFLWNKWYFDELYHATVIRASMAAAGVADWMDRNIIDLAVNLTGWLGQFASWATGIFDNRAIDGAVNGVADFCSGAGGLLSRLQTGRLRNYLLALSVGALAVIGLLTALG